MEPKLVAGLTNTTKIFRIQCLKKENDTKMFPRLTGGARGGLAGGALGGGDDGGAFGGGLLGGASGGELGGNPGGA